MDIVERRIDVGGLTVQLWEAGRMHDRAVVLLHGGIGDACVNWHQILPELSEHYHVFAPNLPGYGESTLLPDMTMESLVNWLRDLLDALQLDSAVIVGAFIGALLTRLFAAAHPAYTPAVILINGGALPHFPRPLPALLRLPVVGRVALELLGLFAASRRTLDDFLYVKTALTPDLVDSWRQNQGAFKRLLRALIVCRCPDQAIPPVPTLLLCGANDPLMALTTAEEVKAAIPGTVLAPILDCGGLPQLEASDVLVFQIIAFLDNLNRPQLPNSPGVGPLGLP